MVMGKKSKAFDVYLAQCRVPSFRTGKLVDHLLGDDTHVPPTADEIRELVAHLSGIGIRAVLVGSAAIFHHMGGSAHDFRPTVDVDLFVSKDPGEPPEGWSRDLEAVGLKSWISPSGGLVDFLIARHELPGGIHVPSSVASSSSDGIPVASTTDILLMKLNSMREKDLLDAVAFARKVGLPPKDKLRMNKTQAENYDLVRLWIQSRPQANYGS